MRAAAAALAVVLPALVACSKDDAKVDVFPPAVDAGRDAAVVVPTADAALAPCLDRPGELPRAPGQALPCDLLPPDFHP